MLLSDIINEQSIKLNLDGTTKDAVFTELVDTIETAHPEFGRDEMLTALLEREQKMSTGIASGVAIPHGYCRSINTISGAIGISRSGIDYGALDHKPVYVVFMIIMGEAAREYHLRTLNRIFTLVKSEAMNLILKSKHPREVHDILSRLH